jgi:hypothetical protein
LSKRISITYSIPMDRLHDEVLRLYSGIVDELSDYSHQLSYPDKILSFETINEINKINTFVTDLQCRLIDLENIIKGYLHFETQQSLTAEQSAVKNISNLSDKLRTLSQSLGVEDEIAD